MQNCPGCGAVLPSDAPAGLCPQCLLKSEAPTFAESGGAPTPEAPRQVPIPGQMFGGYQILRLLGQGGMGEVYEAEEAQTGRRIALKVMSHALASDQDRKRFLREGRLAASVNHPNVVYIHGSEEIGGAPVISMELVHGGTLKDWLKREGPLPIAKAVEAALQTIAGLEAAHSAGVLHRDIKPANCFLDVDGTVKVGDFGLSVSTLARGESLLTATGSVLGTPAYASPEQLRGEELDATSDIYSVGATLYHLLTGKTPFRATDFVKLITEVLDKQAEAPSALRSEIPAELSRTILKCLAKDRRARFQSYSELREALLPFRAAEVEPAKPARRFIAGFMDDMVAYGPSLLFLAYWSFDPLDNLVRERTLRAALVWVPFYLWYLLYYAILEGRWGAGLGKTVCGLRVVGPDRQVPCVLRAILRTGIYMIPFTVPSFIVMALVPLSRMRAALAHDQTMLTDWLWLPLLALLFISMRRRNGYAAMHDRLSRTRVIVRAKSEPRPVLAEISENLPPLPGPLLHPMEQREKEAGVIGAWGKARFGPYEVTGAIWKTTTEELLAGFDPALRRRVWIHLRSAGAQSVPPARRDLNRAARLRWLATGRTEGGSWDAYEAVEGAPLLALEPHAQPWSAVRFWLLDLSEELSAAMKDPAAAPELALDRVWISSNGRGLLLDFVCPGLPPVAGPAAPLPLATLQGAQDFLDQVAARVVRPLVPLHAGSFLTSLTKGAFEQAAFIVGNLHSLVSKPAQISRAWRSASLAMMPFIIVLFALFLASMVNFEEFRRDRRWADHFPSRPSFRAAGQVYLSAVEESQKKKEKSEDAELARAYLVNHFGDLLTNETFWANQELTGEFSEPERNLLRQAATAHIAPTAAAVEDAEAAVPPRIKDQQRQQHFAFGWIFIGTVMCGSVIFAFVELMGCVAFRQSPILRLFGVAVVNASGESATRSRLCWRWLIVWLPVGGIGLIAAGGLTCAIAARTFTLEVPPDYIGPIAIVGWAATTVAAALLLVAGVYAALRPERGLADLLAGTRLVPR